jgi:hypothetical protein
MGDEFVELFERAGIEKKVEPFARRQLPGVVLAAQPLFSAAELGTLLEIRERVARIRQAFTACTFSQSFRNFSRPMFVSGWL